MARALRPDEPLHVQARSGQFILDFREYDRSGQPNPWEPWRPYYKYLVAALRAEAPEGESFWEILEGRDFHKVWWFYHTQTRYPSQAALKLSLVPPPLQKYFRGFLEEGESRTWAEELDWYSRLEDADHHLWNLAFYTRDILANAPEYGAPASARRTRIPEPQRSALRTADRQRLVDFVNTLEMSNAVTFRTLKAGSGAGTSWATCSSRSSIWLSWTGP